MSDTQYSISLGRYEHLNVGTDREFWELQDLSVLLVTKDEKESIDYFTSLMIREEGELDK